MTDYSDLGSLRAAALNGQVNLSVGLLRDCLVGVVAITESKRVFAILSYGHILGAIC